MNETNGEVISNTLLSDCTTIKNEARFNIRHQIGAETQDWLHCVRGILAFKALRKTYGVSAQELAGEMEFIAPEVEGMEEMDDPYLDQRYSGVIITGLDRYAVEPLLISWKAYAFECDLLDFLGIDVAELMDEPSRISAATCASIADITGKLIRDEIKTPLPDILCQLYGASRHYCWHREHVPAWESLRSTWAEFSRQGGAIKHANPFPWDYEDVAFYGIWGGKMTEAGKRRTKAI